MFIHPLTEDGRLRYAATGGYPTLLCQLGDQRCARIACNSASEPDRLGPLYRLVVADSVVDQGRPYRTRQENELPRIHPSNRYIFNILPISHASSACICQSMAPLQGSNFRCRNSARRLRAGIAELVDRLTYAAHDLYCYVLRHPRGHGRGRRHRRR